MSEGKHEPHQSQPSRQGTDCGFAQEELNRRVHPSVMWAKLEAAYGSPPDLAKIVDRSAGILGVTIEPERIVHIPTGVPDTYGFNGIPLPNALATDCWGPDGRPTYRRRDWDPDPARRLVDYMRRYRRSFQVGFACVIAASMMSLTVWPSRIFSAISSSSDVVPAI